MDPRRILFFLLLVLLSTAGPTSSPAVAEAAKPYIDAVSIGVGERQDLVVGFRVARTRGSRVAEAVESGLPVRFTFRVVLARPRRLLPDLTLADVEFDRVLEKDNLKDRFRITFEDGSTVTDLPDLETALDRMSVVDRVSLLPVDAVDRSGPVFLKIKARLQEFKLPFRLHYVLAFVSAWDVATDWYVVALPSHLPERP